VRENPNTGGSEDDAALTTVEAIEELGGTAAYVACDVTTEDQVDHLVARIDVMVNNAGVYRNGKRLHEFDETDLDVCYAVNVKGTFFGAKAAIRQMLEQGDGGVIVNLVSTAGLQGYPNQSVYNISKGAAANLTRCLAVEYGKDKIRVNGICPTYAKTSLTRELFDDKDFDQVFTESIPLKRWGEVEDVANLAVFLASDESGYIHGDLIKVDGGETSAATRSDDYLLTTNL
jgi:NAD(P)-dependent dehydrogenase (short-subunit alcohol dehydrogenase family)